MALNQNSLDQKRLKFMKIKFVIISLLLLAAVAAFYLSANPNPKIQHVSKEIKLDKK